MRKIIMVFAISGLLVNSVSLASIPDGDVVEGRFELSGFTGKGVVTVTNDDTKQDFETDYTWQSIELDYGVDDQVGIGIGYWGQTYLDDPYFDDSFSALLAGIFVPFAAISPTYIDQLADVHVRSQFINEKDGAALNASWVIGVGQVQGRTETGMRVSYVIPELGFALSKVFYDRLALRLNIVTGIPAGAEIGLRIIDNLEVTYGNEGIFNVKLIF